MAADWTTIEIVTESAEETQALARALGERLRGGEVIALDGSLGAGKTCFTQGLAAGLEVPEADRLTSPSYTLMNEYAGRLPLYHFDAYFVAKGDSLSEAGADDYLFGDGVCVIEWSERVAEILPEGHWQIRIEILGPERRRVRLDGPRTVLDDLRGWSGGPARD